MSLKIRYWGFNGAGMCRRPRQDWCTFRCCGLLVAVLLSSVAFVAIICSVLVAIVVVASVMASTNIGYEVLVPAIFGNVALVFVTAMTIWHPRTAAVCVLRH